MKLVRAHNPAETLLIVNPKRRGTKMKRRKTVTNRRRHNPRGAAHRRTALVANRRRNRRRNPHVQSLVMGALYAGAGAMVTQVIAGFIPIGGGGWMDIVKQLVAAYGTGYIAERFTSPANANLMAIGGFAGAATSAVRMLLGSAGSIFSNFGPPPAQVGDGTSDVTFYPGMGDLVAAPDEYDQPGY